MWVLVIDFSADEIAKLAPGNSYLFHLKPFSVGDSKEVVWSKCIQCLDGSFSGYIGEACSFGRPTNWSRDKEIMGMVEGEKVDCSHIKSTFLVVEWHLLDTAIYGLLLILSNTFCFLTLPIFFSVYPRFGDVKLQTPDNEAQTFQENYAGNFFECHLNLLNVLRGGCYLPDRVTHLVLQYLSNRFVQLLLGLWTTVNYITHAHLKNPPWLFPLVRESFYIWPSGQWSGFRTMRSQGKKYYVIFSHMSKFSLLELAGTCCWSTDRR